MNTLSNKIISTFSPLEFILALFSDLQTGTFEAEVSIKIVRLTDVLIGIVQM